MNSRGGAPAEPYGLQAPAVLASGAQPFRILQRAWRPRLNKRDVRTSSSKEKPLDSIPNIHSFDALRRIFASIVRKKNKFFFFFQQKKTYLRTPKLYLRCIF
jgi:hypothetical protein